MRFCPDSFGMHRLFLLGVLLFFFPQPSLHAGSDSLQVRMYHGLDEMGAGNAFFWRYEHDKFWSSWQGNTNVWYRRPTGSQGELKTDWYYQGQLGKTLSPTLDVKAVFEGDFYQFRRFSGPSPQAPAVLDPPLFLELIGPGTLPPVPPQQIERSLLGLGSTFKPDTLLLLTTLIGPRWERREGFDDQGIAASLTTSLQGLEFKGYRNDLDLFLEQEELGARLNREFRFQYGLDKTFSRNSSNRLEIYYRQKRHDYHVWGSSAIGTRTDTDQSFRNQLRYDLSPQLGFSLDTDLTGSRHEDRSPTASALREEIGTSNALTLRGTREKVSGWLRLKFNWGAQEDATGLKRERGTSLESNLFWIPTKADSLGFASAVRKRQYDTSDTSNYDDRDRLRYEFDLLCGHAFNSRFRTAIRAQVILDHLVYIFSEKSDQNNWNRIFKLAPEVYFEPHPAWRNLTRFELVANTTSYDFELDPGFIKSTIYRRFTAADSLVCSLNRGWSLLLEYSFDLEDGGRFIWGDWVQQISDEYRTHTMAILIIRETRAGIRFDAGASIYDRRGWEYTIEPELGTVKSPFLYLSRWGPLLQLTYPSASGIRIEAGGDLSWVHEWGREDYTIVNLDLRITWR